MLKKSLLASASVITLVAAYSANAVTIDYVALASGNEHGDAQIVVNDPGGLSVTATGFDTGSGAAYSAYLDDVSGGPGGLGVCRVLTASDQCDPSSDDNVTFGESLKLVFNQAVTIDQITFNNGDHKQFFSGNFEVTIGGTTTPYALTNIFTTPLTGTEFIFSNPNSLGGSGMSNEYQFYIGALEVTAVPVPAAVWLFGSGLLGLVAVARRRI